MSDERNGAVTVGNFDGVHRGHVALLSVLRDAARQVGGPAVVVTFNPHPIALLAPEKLRPILTTPSDRAQLLKSAGADHVVILETTRELLNLEPIAFLSSILGDRLVAQAVIEGFNFQFGRGRSGTNETIAEWCDNREIRFSVVPPFQLHGVTVSSSRVREALEAGDVLAATEQLGRRYRLRGTVGSGAKRGQSIGFPTANLEEMATLIPGDGVYACTAKLADGTTWPVAVNIGPNPTFGERNRKIEAHLIGFSGNLYAQELTLDFVARLRDTRKFANLDELKAQLQTDIDLAASLATRERVTSDAAK